jgi:Luciferase
MSYRGASATIRAAVLAWPATSAAPHRFGGVAFRLNHREIGHLHGDALLDVPFPRAVRDELVGAGLAEAHHVLPKSGWVSFRINSAGDVDSAVALLRRSYQIVADQQARRKAQTEAARRSRNVA